MFNLFKPATTEAANAGAASSPRPSEHRTVSPRVDIHETDEAVQVVADMPGVAADGVEVRIHADVLTLRGSNRVQEPERFTAVWREWRPRDYERTFRLGHAIDAERIAASAKDGVVRVTLPKRVTAQPKRIAVQAG